MDKTLNQNWEQTSFSLLQENTSCNQNPLDYFLCRFIGWFHFCFLNCNCHVEIVLANISVILNKIYEKGVCLESFVGYEGVVGDSSYY